VLIAGFCGACWQHLAINDGFLWLSAAVMVFAGMFPAY
jgi:hypothetical protein